MTVNDLQLPLKQLGVKYLTQGHIDGYVAVGIRENQIKSEKIQLCDQ